MDTAKAIGIIIANPEFEDVRSLEGVAPTKKPCVPIIAVPTTAGTAAEVTINYVITDVEKKRKFVCVDTHDIPVVAVIDPEMMSSMPKGLTAATGMDALTHAIEGYTTKAAWEMTDMFHLKAIEIISKSLRGAVANKAAVDAVKKLSQDVGIPADLKAIVKDEDVQFLAESAYADACRPGNPRDTSVEEIKALYRSLM